MSAALRLATEMPRRLRTLERDRRGYPIPFIVMRDRKGAPHFPVNDTVRIEICIRRKRCGLCGKRFDAGMWFIGGPRCFGPDGAFLDPPSHEDCARYALAVCPYLAAPNYDTRIDFGTLAPGDVPFGAVVVSHDTVPDARPDTFWFGQTRDYRLVEIQPGQVGFVVADWDRLEIWRHGRQVVGGA